MEFDFSVLEPQSRYRLLTNFIGPRPIALVTTRSEAGHNNAAPMSFFNVFSHDPPIVVLGIQPKLSGEEKDTMVNIRRTGEFVINMVDMALSEQMLICGLGFDNEVDEMSMAQLTAKPCSKIDASYAAQSPCAFECRVERLIDYPAARWCWAKWCTCMSIKSASTKRGGMSIPIATSRSPGFTPTTTSPRIASSF